MPNLFSSGRGDNTLAEDKMMGLKEEQIEGKIREKRNWIK